MVHILVTITFIRTRADRQTNKQTDKRQIYPNAIPSYSPLGAKVINYNNDHQCAIQ